MKKIRKLSFAIFLIIGIEASHAQTISSALSSSPSTCDTACGTNSLATISNGTSNSSSLGFLSGTLILGYNSSTTLPIPSGYSRSQCHFYATVGADTSDSNDYTNYEISFDTNGNVSSYHTGDYSTTRVNYMVLCY